MKRKGRDLIALTFIGAVLRPGGAERVQMVWQERGLDLMIAHQLKAPSLTPRPSPPPPPSVLSILLEVGRQTVRPSVCLPAAYFAAAA
jgi:hypothetical protein